MLFRSDVARTGQLRDAIPEGIAVVSESGISEAAQLRALEAEGVDAVLVGELLMRADDPARALDELRGQERIADRDGAGGRQSGESETAKLRAARF